MSDIKIKKEIIWAITILVVVIVGVFAFVKDNSNSVTGNVVKTGNIGTSVGDIAPDFSITDVDGRAYTLSKLKKPTVIAFFATWCTPCIIEANNVKQVDDESGNFEVFQIGVDNRESLNDLIQFKNQYGNKDWIVGFGFDIAQIYGVKTLDTTLIVDENGIIVYRDNGIPADVDTLREWLT